MKAHAVRRFSRSSFIRLGLLTLFSTFAASMCGRVKAGNKSKPTVKASRLKTLSKGFNLDYWLFHGLADGHYTEATLQEYKNLGLTHTRLPIVVSVFLDDNNPSVLKTDSLAALDAIIRLHVKTGLGIILSPFNHPAEMYSDPAVLAKFVAFSKAFATHLSSTEPEKVFLEVMNEPIAAKPQIWNNIQVKLIPAIRSGAPNHTIIASSNVHLSANDWDNVGSLPLTQIVPDDNVVYNFHFYKSLVFTHQGASWAGSLKLLKDIPYPSTPAAVAPLLDAIQDAEAKSAVENYGKENWNRNKCVSVLAPVADWAKTNGVPVICNEFGALPSTAPRDSLLRYLKDVREVLESYEIGWAEWFGLDVHDNELMQALGLTPLRRP